MVYGLSSTNARVFELHKFLANSATEVVSVTLLASKSADYIMQSCDYTGGAWFRSINPEEEHAFYDPGVNQFY